MSYVLSAVERAIKVQEVILRALIGQLTWPQAADILGQSPRSIRRLRWCYERYGYDGLFDRRRRIPSPRRAPSRRSSACCASTVSATWASTSGTSSAMRAPSTA